MRVYTKYRTKPARKPSGSQFHWLLAAMLGAFLVWVWWKNLQDATTDHEAHPFGRGDLPLMARSARGASNGLLSAVNGPELDLRELDRAGLRAPRTTYELQIALERQVISCGSIDGLLGSQTRAAVRAFQQRERLPITGNVDATTKSKLLLGGSLERHYTITHEELGRLSPVGPTWLAKSFQDRLDYESVLELVAEKAHAHPSLIRSLNPSVDWNNVRAGTTLRIPDVEFPPPRGKAAVVRIRLRERMLDAFDRGTNLLAHFPCSIARQVQKRPIGWLYVETIVLNPNYKFSPEIYPESDEARELKRPLMIPQGPNNPVGTAWIGLNKPGYGIHGTPRPEEVGRTESHGCFRLANWNAEYLAQLVEAGTPVVVEP